MIQSIRNIMIYVKTLYSVLHTATQKAEYYLKAGGEVYDVYYKVS